jgi:uncharacterized membrane protein ArfC
MMHDVNWWLMALSFVLGLVITLLFMIRRVTREVPIYAALGRGPKVDVRKPDVEVRKPDVEVRKPDLNAPAVAATAATAAAGAAAVKLVKDEPYGTGSVRFSKTVAPPRTEYLVKGDEDTMRYFTVESPDYERVGAEVWFQDAASAERAGFLRWDAPGDYTVTDNVGGTVIRDEDTTVIRDEDTTATTKFASVVGEPEAGPYGTGSARAGAGGVGPAGWTIKGNEDSMLFHTPASPAYDATIAEVWFADEATAEAAGFKKYK